MPFSPRAPIPRGFTTRFAPAPTGKLHLGHVVSAIWVWGLARAHGGRVLLRIEDHDRGRSRAEYERGILEDLDWLGFEPQKSIGDRFRQSDSLSRYESVLGVLERDGLAYACDCSRSGIGRALGLGTGRDESPVRAGTVGVARVAQAAISEAGTEVRYPGTCRSRGLRLDTTRARRVRFDDAGPERFTDLRLGDQEQDPALQCGDLLLRDRDGNFTYQFAAVVDDLDMGVDLVIRGEDILASTGRQIRLARMLGRTAPPAFLHHPLVRGADGRKLSKSAGDTGVSELRAAGRARDAVLGQAAKLAGLHESGAPLGPGDIAALFG